MTDLYVFKENALIQTKQAVNWGGRGSVGGVGGLPDLWNVTNCASILI